MHSINPEIPSRIRVVWDNPSLLDPVLGTPGFKLPAVESLIWRDIINYPSNVMLCSRLLKELPHRSLQIHATPKATNNVFIVEDGADLSGQIFLFGSNNVGIIRRSRGHNPINIHFNSNNCLFYWGRDCTSNTTTFRVSGDQSSIIVGEDCMFSSGINVQSHDDHSIIDLTSGSVLNPPSSVRFGPHVWVGRDCTVLKGVNIGFGAVIGTRSVVTRDIPEKTIVAGSPAKVIRSNVGWLRDRTVGADAIMRFQEIEASVKSDRGA